MEKQIFEIAMLVLFGTAWPFSIVKSWKSGTTAGKSVVFLWVVSAGYLCGIVNKVLNGDYRLVFVFYVLDLLMVLADLSLYYRNRRRDVVRSGEVRA